MKFAALEFKSGLHVPEQERVSRAEFGRTKLAKLLAPVDKKEDKKSKDKPDYSKRLDLWGQWLDLETGLYGREEGIRKGMGDKEKVRGVFGQMAKAVNKKSAIGFFGRWAKWEAEHGDKKSQEKVAARKAEWANQNKKVAA